MTVLFEEINNRDDTKKFTKLIKTTKNIYKFYIFSRVSLKISRSVSEKLKLQNYFKLLRDFVWIEIEI